jgi:DNA-binding MarR family transcriptional regulator
MTAIQPKRGAARPASNQETEELAGILMLIQRRFLVNLSRELGRGNVSFVQFFLLTALAQGDSLTMSEIAKKMGHTTAAATGLVDRLENLHYLERSHATDDRRKVRVKTTPKGNSLVTRIKQDMVHNLTSIMTHLTAAERKAWLQIYRKVHVLCQRTDAQILET